MDISYLFISHDLTVVRYIAHDLAVMYLGKVVESGPAAQIFAWPRHPYTEALLKAAHRPDPAYKTDHVYLVGEQPSALDRAPGCPLYIRYRKPAPLIARRDIIPIGGRLDCDGNELAPLDHEDLRRAAHRIRSEGVRSVAIAFLFSYQNPDHELAAAQVLEELAPGVSISVSHPVATAWREYERTASTVMDAYIAPSVSRYMADLSTRLGNRGMPASLRVMQSNGGVISAQAASERPLQTLLSGPVGGAAGGVASPTPRFWTGPT